jgi:endo-1,4-beta-xylanase
MFQQWEPLLVMDSKTGTEVYNFEHADKIMQWAMHHDKIVKGHTLVWHVTSPTWIHTCSAARLREATFEHIKTAMSHWYGQMDAWDIVNEALAYAADGSMADTPFLQKLGGNYIDECFAVAHHTDPTARLIYNDNKVEGAGLPNNRSMKADAMYTLVQGMVERGVPIHEVGLQCHFDASGTGLRRIPTPHSIARNIARYADLGLTVNISEMDVRTANLEGLSITERDAVAEMIYHDTLAAAMSQSNFTGATFWGFTDR